MPLSSHRNTSDSILINKLSPINIPIDPQVDTLNYSRYTGAYGWYLYSLFTNDIREYFIGDRYYSQPIHTGKSPLFL